MNFITCVPSKLLDSVLSPFSQIYCFPPPPIHTHKSFSLLYGFHKPLDRLTFRSVKDDEETAVTVWGSREQLLENYLICFHKAMTSAHKSSNYIEAGSVQAQPRVILENVDILQHIHLRVITWANCD